MAKKFMGHACEYKRTYRTAEEAHQAILGIVKRKNSGGSKTKYKCRFCGGWHLKTSDNKRKKLERRKQNTLKKGEPMHRD
jgi:hypothetical protein